VILVDALGRHRGFEPGGPRGTRTHNPRIKRLS
jgi:hypothetical protein